VTALLELLTALLIVHSGSVMGHGSVTDYMLNFCINTFLNRCHNTNSHKTTWGVQQTVVSSSSLAATLWYCRTNYCSSVSCSHDIAKNCFKSILRPYQINLMFLVLPSRMTRQIEKKKNGTCMLKNIQAMLLYVLTASRTCTAVAFIFCMCDIICHVCTIGSTAICYMWPSHCLDQQKCHKYKAE